MANDGTAEVDPQSVVPGNFVRHGDLEPWLRVTELLGEIPNGIRVGRRGAGQPGGGPPSITPAEPETAVAFVVDNGTEVRFAAVDPITVKTEQASLIDLREGDTIADPRSGKWFTISRIEKGSTSVYRRSAHGEETVVQEFRVYHGAGDEELDSRTVNGPLQRRVRA